MIARQLIKEKGYTIQEVADKMGISRVTLHQILQRNTFSTSTLRRIADAIDCRIGDFFVDEMSGDTPEYNCPHCGKPVKVKITLS